MASTGKLYCEVMYILTMLNIGNNPEWKTFAEIHFKH